MFDKENFIQNCIKASEDGLEAVSEVVKEVLCHPAKIISELGEPEHAGIYPLYRSKALTIINFTWAPCMSLMPHNHQMAAVIGIYPKPFKMQDFSNRKSVHIQGIKVKC